MTATINDTLRKQIERGVVFYGYASNTDLADAAAVEILIRIGSVTTELIFAMGAETTSIISLTEDVTVSATGSSLPLNNMNRDSAETTGATTFLGPTTSGGANKYLQYAYDGRISNISPINSENGILLKASTDYKLSITNSSGFAGSYTFNWFLREI